MQPDSAMSEATLAYVMETAPVLALRLDANKRVTVANAHALRILGPGVVGQTLADLMVDFIDAPKSASDGDGPLSLKTACGVPETFQFRRFTLTDGTLVLGSVDFTEHERLRTEVLGLNGELSNLTRQLHQTNAELRELNALKNQFLGMAAHDLRAPIGIITTSSEFVLDQAGEQLGPDLREILQMCLTSSIDMNRMIEAFLDLSVIESGHLRLVRNPASASKILSGALPISRMVAKNKDVSLLVEPADETRTLEVDAPKLQQVLLNLVRNAVEHSMPGQRVWISSHWNDKNLSFTVRDEGPGISPEQREKLFTAYAKAGARKTAGERSVGLGLAIARMVIEAHGGRIWFDSVPGQGATFQFSVPIQTQLPTQETMLR